MVRDKVRIRFRKADDLRLVSHHDLMRTFERMLRRAALPFHSTSGFNPKPRLIFALSLSLGVIGCAEVAELELDAEVSPEEVRQRLAAQAPPGLEILEARRIDPRAGAQVRQVSYRLRLPPDRAAELPPRITALLDSPECWVDRLRPQPRRFDLRPYLIDLRLSAAALDMDLRVTPTGMARPDEVLTLLGLADLLDAGGILERTAVEIEDESASGGREPPVNGAAAEGAPLTGG